MGAQATEITDQTVIEAHDLALRKERNDEWYIGREDLGSFIALPELWAQAVIFMSQKNHFTNTFPTFGAVKQFVHTKTRDDAEFQAEIDRELRLLIGQLVQYRIIRAIGPTVFDEQSQVRDLLPSLKTRHVRWLFSPASYAGIGLLLLVAIGMMISDTALRPHLSAYFWHPRPGLSLLTAMISAWVLVFQHEFFHVVAARAARLTAELRISTRGPFLIMEAKVHNLLKASRRDRIRVYAAGMIADAVTAAVGTILLWACVRGMLPWPDWAVGILRQVILLRLIVIPWQFMLALRTDVTNVFVDLLGDQNLHAKATAYLKERWHHIRHPLARGTQHLHERTAVPATPETKRFALGLLASMVLAGGFYLIVKLPILLELIGRTGTELAVGLRGNGTALADSFLVLGMLGWMFVLYVRSKRGSARRAPVAGR